MAGGEATLRAGGPGDEIPPRWSPDGGQLIFASSRDGGIFKLSIANRDGGGARAIGEPEYVVRTTGTWHVHNGGWSPDSKSLVYTQDQDYGDLYELVEVR